MKPDQLLILMSTGSSLLSANGQSFTRCFGPSLLWYLLTFHFQIANFPQRKHPKQLAATLALFAKPGVHILQLCLTAATYCIKWILGRDARFLQTRTTRYVFQREGVICLFQPFLTFAANLVRDSDWLRRRPDRRRASWCSKCAAKVASLLRTCPVGYRAQP